MPLSQGRLLEDTVQCGYHGLEFAFDGRCVKVPGQSTIPPGARVRAWPAVERWRWVWIWMGDPDAADPDLIPDYHWNDDPEWTAYGDVYHVAGDYRLMNDNLLDLSHIQFLHANTLGAPGDQDAEIEVRRGPDVVHVSRWTFDTPPSPFYAHALGTDANVDRWQNVYFRPPSYIVIDAGSAIAGSGAREGDRSRAAEVYSNHTMTPETGTSTHYFWHHARNFRLDDAAFTEELRGMFSSALKEDVVAIEAQQKSLARSARPAHRRHQRRQRRLPGTAHPGGTPRRRGRFLTRESRQRKGAPVSPAPHLATVANLPRNASRVKRYFARSE